jgi:hypothetical protein
MQRRVILAMALALPAATSAGILRDLAPPTAFAVTHMLSLKPQMTSPLPVHHRSVVRSAGMSWRCNDCAESCCHQANYVVTQKERIDVVY